MKKSTCLLTAIFILSISLYGCSNNDDSNTKNIINDIGNCSNNIADQGYAAKQGAWLFYYREGAFLSMGEGLYKSMENGSKEKKILSGTISDINVLGEWIYFVLQEKETKGDYTIDRYNLYKVKVDGSQKSLVAKDCNNINIINDTIYYEICVDTMGYKDWGISNYPLKDENGDLHSMKLDGSEKKLVGKKAEEYIIYGDYLFYILDGNVYRSNTDGTDAKIIIQSIGEVTDFKVDNNIIYYTTEEADNLNSNIYIHNISLGTTKKISVKDKQLININPYKGNIYCTTSNFQVYKINCNDLSEKKLAENILRTYIFDGSIYGWTGEEKLIRLN